MPLWSNFSCRIMLYAAHCLMWAAHEFGCSCMISFSMADLTSGLLDGPSLCKIITTAQHCLFYSSQQKRSIFSEVLQLCQKPQMSQNGALREVELVLWRISVAALWVLLWLFHLQFNWNPKGLGHSPSLPLFFVSVSDVGHSPCNLLLGNEPELDVIQWERMKGRHIMTELMTLLSWLDSTGQKCTKNTH